MCKKGCVVKRAEGDEFGKGTSFRDSKLDADDIYKSSDVWNTECWNPTLRVFNNQGEKVADGLIGRCALTAAILLSHLRLRTNRIVARWTPWKTTSFLFLDSILFYGERLERYLYPVFSFTLEKQSNRCQMGSFLLAWKDGTSENDSDCNHSFLWFALENDLNRCKRCSLREMDFLH